MSLFESMNYKEKRPLYEGEEKITYEPVGVPDVKSEEKPAAQYKYTSWWESPSFVAQAQQRQQEAQKRAADDEKRAKWQRNAAIFSDLARLGAQAYAVSGGATQVGTFTPQTKIANERLAAIRDRNAAQIEAYAREMQAARNAEAKDRMARNKAEMDYAQADAAAKAKAAKDVADREYKIYRDAVADKKHRENIESRERMAANRLKSQERMAANRLKSQERMAAEKGARTKEEQELYDEYQNLLLENPEYMVTKMVVKRNPITNMIERDDDGKPMYDVIEEPNPTPNQVRNAIARANAERGNIGSGVLKSGYQGSGSPLRNNVKSKSTATW